MLIFSLNLSMLLQKVKVEEMSYIILKLWDLILGQPERLNSFSIVEIFGLLVSSQIVSWR